MFPQICDFFICQLTCWRQVAWIICARLTFTFMSRPRLQRWISNNIRSFPIGGFPINYERVGFIFLEQLKSFSVKLRQFWTMATVGNAYHTILQQVPIPSRQDKYQSKLLCFPKGYRKWIYVLLPFNTGSQLILLGWGVWTLPKTFVWHLHLLHHFHMRHQLLHRGKITSFKFKY